MNNSNVILEVLGEKIEELTLKNAVLQDENLKLKEGKEEKNDTSREFFHNYTSPKPGINTPIKDLYSAYRRFCDDNYYTPLAKNTFGKQLKSFGVQQKIIKNERTYLNIALKELEKK